jgi:hypothetical protein
MSGGNPTSSAKQGIGILGAITAVAAAPGTGGASLAALPGALALTKNGMDQAASQQKRAQQALQNSLLKPISKPQVAPTPDNAAVQQQRANSLIQLQQRSGRASTLLTNQGPSANNTFGG